MAAHRIAVIEGDGIGKEVVPEGIRVLEAAARRFGLDLRWDRLDWGCDHHARFGRMMPENGLDGIAGHDAIFLGAIGWPTVSDVESLWTLLMPIRRNFQQYVNLRPVRLMNGVRSPLADPGAIDMMIVRENNEGEYSEVGGRMFPGTDQEMVVQDTIFTRHGCDRVMRFAFDLARTRKRRLTAATKSNGIIHTMPYWDERFRAVARTIRTSRPRNTTSTFSPRISSAALRASTSWWRAICSATSSPISVPPLRGPSASRPRAISIPSGDFPRCSSRSMARPPTSPGKNIANPIGQIWSGAMMLDHLGATEAAAAIVAAIETGAGVR